ncbi:MAG: GNAT family N-acetyltransferase [Proteobacteria bacterium]|nr:GNAT family N-acetyltransferase [Pseudomonadota bacterium]
MIRIRTAQPGDGAILMETTRALAASHDVLHTVTATAADYEHALFRPDAVIGALLAFVDDVPAGAAVWHRSFSTNRGKEVMYLEDLSVLPAYRRRGVAQALLKDVARLAVSKGYPSVYWIMMEWNAAARDLYAKAGAEIEEGTCFCRIEGAALAELAS